MANREQRYIDGDILWTIQKEYDAEQVQEMIVAGDHMLRAKIHERQQCMSRVTLEEVRVSRCDAMSKKHAGE